MLGQLRGAFKRHPKISIYHRKNPSCERRYDSTLTPQLSFTPQPRMMIMKAIYNNQPVPTVNRRPMQMLVWLVVVVGGWSSNTIAINETIFFMHFFSSIVSCIFPICCYMALTMATDRAKRSLSYYSIPSTSIILNDGSFLLNKI